MLQQCAGKVVLSTKTYLLSILGLTIQGQGLGLRIFSTKITRPHNSVRFLDLVLYQEVPKLSFQQQLRSRVDKTTAQQPNVQQFETNPRQELGKFSVKILDLIIKHEIPELKLLSTRSSG